MQRSHSAAGNSLLSLLAVVVAVISFQFLTVTAAFALPSFDFVSSGGQFTIANGTLSFGNGLTVSAASLNGVNDNALTGATVLLDPISLSGIVSALPGGLSQFGIDTSIDYALSIYQSPDDGGNLLLSAIYDPSDFIVIGASGLISAPIENSLTDVVVALPGFSAVVDALGVATNLIDFNGTLSAAGQDIAARIQNGQLVAGSVAGSVAVVPEPTTAVLMGLGLAGLAASSRRIRRTTEN